MTGLIMNERIINNLTYTNDMVLLTESQQELHDLVKRVNTAENLGWILHF